MGLASLTMKITFTFIFAFAASHALPENDRSSRMLDPSVPLCLDEINNLMRLNVIFREGFNSDESSLSCVIHSNVENHDFHLKTAYCNYDEVSASTAENCERSNGILYNVHAWETCTQHPGDPEDEGMPPFYIDTEYENAYLCVGKSCDVDDVLEIYQSEIESSGRCTLTFKATRSETHPENSHEDDTSSSLTSTLSSEDLPSSKSTSTSSSEDEATLSITEYHPGVIVFAWVFALMGILIIIVGICMAAKGQCSDDNVVGGDNMEYMGRRYEIEDDEGDMVAVQIT